MRRKCPCGLAVAPALMLALVGSEPALSLPPASDVPEEVLRTEIFTAARSPVNGKPLTAAEYAELQAQLLSAPTPSLNADVRQLIFLLRVRKLIRTIVPFAPI